MTDFTAFDIQMMAKALHLAEKGQFLARPNPRVGCVITQGQTLVGQGYHPCFGQAHAEVNALKQAGEQAKGATAYVTLEPCAHQGKTGPCAQALIDAGIARVICAMSDPNPKVAGQGFAMLQQAGIGVEQGLLSLQARALNPGFFKRMTTGMPLVRIKLAMSVDGRTAMDSGESQWITGAVARQDVQMLRARHDAIITGTGTLRQDDPKLTVRLDELDWPHAEHSKADFRQPIRILIDRKAKADLRQTFFKLDSPIWWVGEQDYLERLPEHMVRKKIPGRDEPFLRALLRQCAVAECNEVLVEAGAKLAGEFLKAQLVDELILYLAPKLLGSAARPLFHLPLDTMEQAQALFLTDCRQIGNDLRLTYRLSAH